MDNRYRLLFATLLAAALALRVPTAAAQAGVPVTVFDIATAEAAQVESLKRLPPGAWWIELDKHLVVVGADPAPATRVVAHHAVVAEDSLVLRARGCGHEEHAEGEVIASGGRWELRRIEPSRMSQLQRDEPLAWRKAPRDVVVARQHRLDRRGPASLPDANVQQVVDRIDAGRWYADVETLASWDRSSFAGASLEAARDWIGAEFAALGLETSLQAFTMPGPRGTITRHNVIGTWTGRTQPQRWVVVGAHYDSRNAVSSSTLATPGAEDNATGCAGVIELARALLPSQPARSIAFMCYAGEEQGLHGSLAHMQSLTQAGQAAQVDLVAIMDMIGYSVDGELEALFESSAGQVAYLDQYAAMAATYAPELAVVTSTFPFGSDHMPYINAGLRAALSIENDWDIYPHYHVSTDTPANIGPHVQAMGAAILKTNAALIADLGGLAPEPFRDGFEDVAR